MTQLRVTGTHVSTGQGYKSVASLTARAWPPSHIDRITIRAELASLGSVGRRVKKVAGYGLGLARSTTIIQKKKNVDTASSYCGFSDSE